MATALSVGEFRSYFGNIFADQTEFPADTIQLQLNQAMLEVNENTFKKYYARAAYYLTAHFLCLVTEQQRATSSGFNSEVSNPKGVISSVSVGDLSLTQDMPEYSSSGNDRFLASTSFGQEFIRLRDKMSRGPLLGNKPPTSMY